MPGLTTISNVKHFPKRLAVDVPIADERSVGKNVAGKIPVEPLVDLLLVHVGRDENHDEEHAAHQAKKAGEHCGQLGIERHGHAPPRPPGPRTCTPRPRP